MINHYFSLICKHAVVDESTKFLSIFDVIERINVKAKHGLTTRIPMRFDLVSCWVKSGNSEPESGNSRVSLNYPDGNISKIVETDIEFVDTINFRQVVQFSGIELKGSGMYKFTIEFRQNDDEWEKVSEIPFKVLYKTPEKTDQST